MKKRKRLLAILISFCMILPLLSNQYMLVSKAIELGDQTDGNTVQWSDVPSLETTGVIKTDGTKVTLRDEDVIRVANSPMSPEGEMEVVAQVVTVPANSAVLLQAEMNNVDADENASQVYSVYVLDGDTRMNDLSISTGQPGTVSNLYNQSSEDKDYTIIITKDTIGSFANVSLCAFLEKSYTEVEEVQPGQIDIPEVASFVSVPNEYGINGKDYYYGYSVRVTVPGDAEYGLKMSYIGETNEAEEDYWSVTAFPVDQPNNYCTGEWITTEKGSSTIISLQQGKEYFISAILSNKSYQPEGCMKDVRLELVKAKNVNSMVSDATVVSGEKTYTQDDGMEYLGQTGNGKLFKVDLPANYEVSVTHDSNSWMDVYELVDGQLSCLIGLFSSNEYIIRNNASDMRTYYVFVYTSNKTYYVTFGAIQEQPAYILLSKAEIPELSVGKPLVTTQLQKQNITYPWLAYRDWTKEDSVIEDTKESGYWCKFIVPESECYALSVSYDGDASGLSGSCEAYIAKYDPAWDVYERDGNQYSLASYNRFSADMGTYAKGTYYLYMNGCENVPDININLEALDKVSTLPDSDVYEVTKEDFEKGYFEVTPSNKQYAFCCNDSAEFAPSYLASYGALAKITIPAGEAYTLTGTTNLVYEEGCLDKNCLAGSILESDVEKTYYVWVRTNTPGDSEYGGALAVYIEKINWISDNLEKATVLQEGSSYSYNSSSEDNQIYYFRNQGYLNSSTGSLVCIEESGWVDITCSFESEYSNANIKVFDAKGNYEREITATASMGTQSIPVDEKAYLFITMSSPFEYSYTKAESRYLSDRVSDDTVTQLVEGSDNVLDGTNKQQYYFLQESVHGGTEYIQRTGVVYKYTVEPNTYVTLRTNPIYGEAFVFSDPAKPYIHFCELYDYGGLNYMYGNDEAEAKTIYVLFSGGWSYSGEDTENIVVTSGILNPKAPALSTFADEAIEIPVGTPYTASNADPYEASYKIAYYNGKFELIEEETSSFGKLYKFVVPSANSAIFKYDSSAHVKVFEDLDAASLLWIGTEGEEYSEIRVDNLTSSDKEYYAWISGDSSGETKCEITLDPLYADEDSICVYGWNTELGDRLEYFYAKYPQYKDRVKYVNLQMGAASENYLSSVAALAGNAKNSTSIVAYDATVVREQLAKAGCVPLSDIGFDEKKYSSAYTYTKEKGTYNGQLMATAWQASVGNIVYDADIAEKVLGTSDPDEVQKYLATPDKFIETARKMKEKGYYMTSGADALALADDGLLHYDIVSPETCADLYERLVQGGYDSGSSAWTDEYFDDMVNGQVFCFFSSTWHTVWTYGAQIDNTDIRAKICPGPFNYAWGGTYLTVYNHDRNNELASLVLETLCCDKETMQKIERETFDYVNNKEVGLYLSKNGYPLAVLADEQNPFAVWHSVGMNGEEYISDDPWISKYAENAIALPNNETYTANADDMYEAWFYTRYWTDDGYEKEEILNSTGKLYKVDVPAWNKAYFDFPNAEDYIYIFDDLDSANLPLGFTELEEGFRFEMNNMSDSDKTYYIWLEGEANAGRKYNVSLRSLLGDKDSVAVISGNAELGMMLSYFYEKYPEYEDKVNYVNLDMTMQSSEYSELVDKLVNQSDISTCIVVQDSSVLQSTIAEDTYSPLSDIGFDETKYANAYDYTKENGTVEGKLKAVTYKAEAGNIIYNAAIAQEVLGTSDPDKVQEYLSTPDKFIETAKKMKEAGYYMTSGADVLRYEVDTLFDDSRLDLYNRLVDGGYDTGNACWSGEYFDDIQSDDVFCFFSCTWHTMYTYAEMASLKNMNICQGPIEYAWGGDYLTVVNKNKNNDVAKLVLEALCCDTEIMASMNEENWTHPNNRVLGAAYAGESQDAGLAGGQNPYAIWHKVASNIGKGVWEKNCINGIYTIEVGADKVINLNTLTEKGFSTDDFGGVTNENAIYDADANTLTVIDLNKVVRYDYMESGVTKSLQFVAYQKNDSDFKDEEDPTVKVEEEVKEDTVTGGETTVSVKVNKDGEVVGKVDETVIKPAESADATITVTENKDATGEIVEDAKIEVTQTTISEEALTKSIEVVEQKTEAYEEAELDVRITEIQASFTDDTEANVGKDVINKIKTLLEEKDINLTLEVSKKTEAGKVEYSWSFKAEAISETNAENIVDINTKITLHDNEDEEYEHKETLSSLIPDNATKCVLSFAHEGALPNNTEVKVNVEGQYEDNTPLFFYHFNIEKQMLEYCGRTVVENSFVPIKISHCSDYVVMDKPAKLAEKIAIDGKASLITGEETTLTATLTPDGAVTDVEWTSSDTKIATVDSNGKVKALKAGTVKITAAAMDGSDVSGSIEITVEEPKVSVTGITLNKTSVSLEEAKTVTLTVTVEPKNASNKAVTWTSDNPSVATVDANGTVTAKKAGKAVITATAKDGSGKKAGCTVTVTAKQEQKPDPKPEVVPDVTVSYRTHVQSFGWQNYVTNGKLSGTSGKAKRLEGINIKVVGNKNLGIQYTTHCQSYGWLPWSANDEMNGTQGEAKRLEAIMIQLTGADKDKYDVYYRVHAQSYGWLGWAKNGAPAGTAGYAKRLEAIQIVVVKKGEKAPGLDYADVKASAGVHNASAYVAKAGTSPVVGAAATSAENPSIPGTDTTNVTYRTHVQSFGWQGWKYNGQMSGTSGMAKRLEGIEIKLTNKQYSGSIVYTTHVQSYGWQGDVNKPSTWKQEGQMAGTSGEAKRLEAICIKLTGEMEKHYDVYYRVHAQSYGWLGWAKNGECSGTAGYGKRLEGIQVVLVPKGGSAPADNYGGVKANRTEAYIAK